jgi:hypothetical protein
MSEWWTYRLTSFLLFSPRTYYRTIELYNIAIWPLQLVGVAIGVAIVGLLIRKHATGRGRIISGLLALCWLWTAWAFHYERYAQINWAATWFALAFVIEALLLGAIGVAARRVDFETSERRGERMAIGLIAIVVIAYPLLTLLTGRQWTTAETFGVAPDPTALVTLAVLALARGRFTWLLWIVPVVWCLLSAATLWAMKVPEALIVSAMAVLALLPRALRLKV